MSALFTVEEIITATRGKLIQGNDKTSIKRVTTNSREVKKGDVFIALVGKKHDAHDFIPDVIKKGAAAVIVSRSVSHIPSEIAVIGVKDTTKALGHIAAYHRLRFRIPVIAITGSAGKTTTKEMIATVLQAKYKVLKNIGTENNQFGVPLTILRMKSSDQIAVLEVGTNMPGDIPWLASIVHPTVVVMTNIGESHLELLKTPAKVFKEKFSLVKVLPRNGIGIVNGDDAFLSKVPQRVQQKVMTFGVEKKSRLRAENIRVVGEKLNFDLAGAGTLILPGTAKANVYNALAAICCGRLFKVGYPEIKERLKNFALRSGRQTHIKTGGITIIDDTYNANPVSFRSALEALSQMKTSGRRILVCGDMLELGPQAPQLHCEIGERAAGVNRILSFGNHSKLIGEAAHRRNASIQILHSSKAEDIEKALRSDLRPGDIVLVKGSRGMHTERFVEFIKKNFN